MQKSGLDFRVQIATGMRHHLGDEMISTTVYDKNGEAFNLAPPLVFTISMKPGYHLSLFSSSTGISQLCNFFPENSQVDQRAALFGSRFPGVDFGRSPIRHA